jgi:hypothetical protein
MSIRANAEYLRALGGPGSGPHKSNGVVAKAASKKAENASKAANDHSGSKLSQTFADLHAEASVAHNKAADAHVTASIAAKTAVTKDYHNQMAAGHRAQADNHFKASGIYGSI